MSKAKWLIDPVTGVPTAWIPEDLLDREGNFLSSRFPDCSLFGKAVATAAGFSRGDKFKDATLTGSHWHLHQVIGEYRGANEGRSRLLFYCTHTDSAAAGAESYRGAAIARMRAGKKITDVTG